MHAPKLHGYDMQHAAEQDMQLLFGYAEYGRKSQKGYISKKAGYAVGTI